MKTEVDVPTRDDIISAIRDATEPLSYFKCMWEAGAAAFNRVDAWSDIDLQLAVEDDRVGDAVAVVEEAVRRVGRINKKLVLPQPTSHGHWQAFYLLNRTSPFLLLDLVIMKRSSSNRFSEPEIHGNAKVAYDKIGFLTTQPVDDRTLSKKLRDRKAFLVPMFELFQSFVQKELNRKNYVEAIVYYNGVTLRPLVELLRIRYCPARHDFYTRYLYYDLPRDIAERLESFYFVSSPDDLRKKHQAAVQWFDKISSDV